MWKEERGEEESMVVTWVAQVRKGVVACVGRVSVMEVKFRREDSWVTAEERAAMSYESGGQAFQA